MLKIVTSWSYCYVIVLLLRNNIPADSILRIIFWPDEQSFVQVHFLQLDLVILALQEPKLQIPKLPQKF